MLQLVSECLVSSACGIISSQINLALTLNGVMYFLCSVLSMFVGQHITSVLVTSCQMYFLSSYFNLQAATGQICCLKTLLSFKIQLIKLQDLLTDLVVLHVACRVKPADEMVNDFTFISILKHTLCLHICRCIIDIFHWFRRNYIKIDISHAFTQIPFLQMKYEWQPSNQ